MNEPPVLHRKIAESVIILGVVACVVVIGRRVLTPGLEPLMGLMLEGSLIVCTAGPLILWRAYASRGYSHVAGVWANPADDKAIWVVVVVLVLAGLVGTTVLVQLESRQVMNEAQGRFDRLSERLVTEGKRRVTLPEYGLRGARAAFAANPSMRREDFRAYVAARNLGEEFPGVLGMGLIKTVAPGQLEAFIARERADGAPDFAVKTGVWAASAPNPNKAEDAASADAYVITYLDPLAPNLPAWGLDVGGDLERRSAIDRAISTGDPAITGRIALVQDQQQRSGFLYLVPVYRSGTVPKTLQERRAALIGVAFAPVIIDVALTGLVDVANAQLDFEVFEGTQPGKSTELYDHDAHLEAIAGTVGVSSSAGRMFHSSSHMRIADRTWTIATSSTAAFEATIDRSVVRIEAVGGMIFTGLLASVVWSMGTSRRRARAFAASMTAELATAKASADRLAEIAKRTSNAVVITDPRGLVEWVNEGFTRISGYTLDEVRGMKPGQVLQGPKSDPASARLMGDAVRTATPVNVEIVNYSKAGTEYRLAIEIVPLRNADGMHTGFMAIESDITEQHAAREAAESANRAKSAFLANMSHEIRTPLTAILGFADVLHEDGNLENAPQHRLETIDTIRKAGSHLLTVINDILDLSKIEADKMTVERVETSLVKIIRDVESMMRPRARIKGVALNAVLTTPVPDRMLSDPTRLRQILMNLIGNAVKFTDRGSVTVYVGVDNSAANARLVIDIEDTGPGMTPEQAKRLFQVFGQADDTVTRRFGGTGLGLTICRRLSTLMGGEVVLLRTVAGRGSCFRLNLPLEPAPGATMVANLEAVGDTPVAERPAATLAGRILLAEDGADNQRLIAYHLKKAGATVAVADNGRMALEMFDKAQAVGEPFDLLLTDMQMPEMDGYTLARRLRQRGSTLPIVALTAHAMAEDRVRCLEAGCDDYATKPIDKPALLATCARWLGKVRTHDISQ